jgi:hypothetical protein
MLNSLILSVILINSSIFQLKKIEYNNNTFSMIKKYYYIEKNCEFCSSMSESFSFTIERINIFLKNNPSTVASSFILKKESDLNYHLTSNHVCESLYDKEDEEKEKIYIDNILSSSFLFYEVYKSNFSIKSKIVLEDLNRKEHKFLKIIKRKDKEDVCIFNTEGSWGKTVILSEKEPVSGEFLYNITGILGIRPEENFIIFIGIYAGSKNNHTFLSTVYAKPGSSGSPIFNVNGKLVGAIHTTFEGIKNISMATKLSVIKNVLNSK